MFKIYGLTSKLSLPFVRSKLCDDAHKTFETVLKLNPNNFTAKVGLAELIFLRTRSPEALGEAVKKIEALKAVALPDEASNADIKIRYCQNLLKVFEEEDKGKKDQEVQTEVKEFKEEIGHGKQVEPKHQEVVQEKNKEIQSKSKDSLKIKESAQLP
jgi:hypothetical protein